MFCFRELFVDDGELLETGDTLVNNRLADTMQRIADDPETFYTGNLADDIIADLQEHGESRYILHWKISR